MDNTPTKCKTCHEDCIHQIDFLMGLSEENRERVMESAASKNCPKDSFLFYEGEAVDAVYYIHSGRVKLSNWDSNGREQIVGIFSEGDTIWEGLFIEGSRYLYSAVCLTDTRICRISRMNLERVMKDPGADLRVIGLLSRKLHDANERIRILSANSSRARLAGFLLQRSRHAGSDTVTFRLDDIAASIHLRAETVSRRLGDFQRDGLIEKTGQSSIRILDLEGLQECFRE